jgi:hypothetical protein
MANQEPTIYLPSLTRQGNETLFIARDSAVKYLYITGQGEVSSQMGGDIIPLPEGPVKRCPLSPANARVLRQFFPFTNPIRHGGKPFTMGLGDRLGLASPGHLRLLQSLPAKERPFPVLAQQSIRELNLTGRTYDDVLAAASWAVFQEGWRHGYGADGDHLKTPAEVKMALDCGFTMITLDCSEFIHNDLAALPEGELDNQLASLPEGLWETLKSEYLNKQFPLADRGEIIFNEAGLKRAVLVYTDALRFAAEIYGTLLYDKDIDFELSIDETASATSPEAHYFIAAELRRAGVKAVSLAPRFCGEFQKGIDYRGELNQFTWEFKLHARIADTFGYKLSIHSGSDKFAVFPVIYRETGHRVHIKTAGTNWLEALRVVAAADPAFFRKMYRYALDHLSEAKQYYHITEDIARIPDIKSLSDSALPGLLDHDDARQVLHVTYGVLLSSRDDTGAFIFKDTLYGILAAGENDYCAALAKRIRKHIP